MIKINRLCTHHKILVALSASQMIDQEGLSTLQPEGVSSPSGDKFQSADGSSDDSEEESSEEEDNDRNRGVQPKKFKNSKSNPSRRNIIAARKTILTAGAPSTITTVAGKEKNVGKDTPSKSQ